MEINKVFDEFLEDVKKKEIVLNYVQVRKKGEIILDWGRMQQKTRLQVEEEWEVPYGFQFWLNKDNSFRADGKYGQYIVVLPEKDMVVAVQGLSDGEVFEEVWNNFIEKI